MGPVPKYRPIQRIRINVRPVRLVIEVCGVAQNVVASLDTRYFSIAEYLVRPTIEELSRRVISSPVAVA